MLFGEITWEEVIELRAKEAYDEGREEGLETGRREERKNSIANAIEICMEVGFSKSDTKKKLSEKFHLSDEEIEDLMNLHWKNNK